MTDEKDKPSMGVEEWTREQAEKWTREEAEKIAASLNQHIAQLTKEKVPDRPTTAKQFKSMVSDAIADDTGIAAFVANVKQKQADKRIGNMADEKDKPSMGVEAWQREQAKKMESKNPGGSLLNENDMAAILPVDDAIDHPQHYTQHPSGIECIEVTEHMSFNLGNAIKYVWRADLKNGVEDLKKARWHLNREIAKREE